jgi:hypothetical protein
MSDQGGSRPQPPGSAPGGAPADEISLFDIWNVLVRRRWILVAVFGLVVAVSVAFALTRATTYRVSQTIEVGKVDGGLVPEEHRRGLVPEESGEELRRVAFFDSPRRVATDVANIHLPAARGDFDAGDADGAAPGAPVSTEVVDDTRLVRMTVEAPAAQVEAYEKLLTTAADRLIDAHGEAEKRARARFQEAVRHAENEVADVQDRLDARRSALDRLEVKQTLITAQIEGLRDLLDRAEKARLEAIEGQPEPIQAMTVMLVANELRKARQELGALRERRDIELPAERADLQNEVASLARQLDVAKGQAERVRARMDDVAGTRVVAPPQRSDAPVSTPWTVLVALGGVLGVIAGVLAAFFAEFVSAARVQAQRTGPR